MKCLVLALPFFSLPAAAWAADDARLPGSLAADVPCVQERRSVDSAPQDEEKLRLEGDSLPVIDYIYRYSEFEFGAIYTDWAGKMKLDSHVGAYARWGVAVHPNFNINIAFRYADLDNSELTGSKDEHVLERALLAGVGVRVPLTREFAATGNAAVGFMRFDSRAANVGSDTGLAFSFEGALSAQLLDTLRLKAGLALDMVRTDFHQTSAEWAYNWTYLVGLEVAF